MTCRMRTVCWIPKDTNKYSECVIIIVFQRQQWLHEHASMLRYTYFICFFIQICWRQVKEPFIRKFITRLFVNEMERGLGCVCVNVLR
jgi:hypothetical protein